MLPNQEDTIILKKNALLSLLICQNREGVNYFWPPYIKYKDVRAMIDWSHHPSEVRNVFQTEI
jgi:hypothetical protein